MPRKQALKCYFGCVPCIGTVHHFPPPEYPNLDKFNQWKMVLSEVDKAKGDTYIYNNIRLCDHHFEECYQTPSKRLTKNAIPTLNIASSSKTMHTSEIKDSDIEDRNKSELTQVHASFCQVSASSSKPHSSGLQDLFSEQRKISDLPEEHASCQATTSTTNDKQMINHSKPAKSHVKHASVMKNTKSISIIKNKALKENTQLKIKLLKMRKKCQDANKLIRKASKISQTKSFLNAIEKLPGPSGIFTKMQLKNISVKPRGRRYTLDEKILCLTIFKQSQKGYRLLQRLFALPSKRSIQKVLNNISLTPGINENIINHLKRTVKKMQEEKKLCILMFDEVALTPGLYYNKTLDEIIGFEDFGGHRTNKIADHALVFMIKGLKGKYKQPICFTFCQSSTKSIELKKLIKLVITEIHGTGLRVIATVCDQSSTNVSVINNLLNETKQKYLIENKEYKSLAFEVDGIKIFPMFDPPHLLKGLRNNLLTKDLRYVQDGEVKVAKWNHLKMLLDADVGEDDIRMINKLTEAHVIKDKIPKMKVSYAAQVFSQRVSAAMRFSAKHNIIPTECLATADLLLLVDKLFDSFNGHSYELSAKRYKCALKQHSPHFQLWNEMLPILRSMNFKVEKNNKDGSTVTKFIKVPSLKNFIHNINVYKEMFPYLCKEHNVSSLLTRNINQDPLENFFCNIRSNGVRNTSPTCSQFIGAFKTLLVNNFTSPHSVGANCEQDNNKALNTLKKLLKQKRSPIEQPNDSIYVDSFINIIMETSEKEKLSMINKEAKRYVAGYIVKKTLKNICKNCHGCRMQLLSTTPPKNNDYILERDYTKKSCHYPSETLCAFLDDVFIIIQTQLNEEPKKKLLNNTIKDIVNIFCNQSLFSCEKHKEELYKYIVNSTINIDIFSWCTNVNRLLKGKLTYCDGNEIKKQALKYYNIHKRGKK